MKVQQTKTFLPRIKSIQQLKLFSKFSFFADGVDNSIHVYYKQVYNEVSHYKVVILVLLVIIFDINVLFLKINK
jgi:hypothetical protein